MNDGAVPRFLIGACLSIAMGLAAAAYALALVQAEPRYAAVGWVALIGGVALLALGSTRRISLALVGALAITLPIIVAKGFFLYPRAPDQYVEHAGNFAVQISLPVLAATAILILQSVSALPQRILTGFRVEPLTASGAGLAFAAGVLSLLNTSDARLVGFELLHLALLYLGTFVVGNFDRRAMKVYLGALAITVLLQGLLAVSEFMVGGTVGLGFLGEMSTQRDQIDFVEVMRPSGTLGAANALGGFFALTLPLFFGLVMTSERRSMRLLYATAFAVGFAGMIVSLSRGSWMTLPLNLAVVVLVVFGRRIFSLKSAAVGAVGVLALMVVAAAIGPIIVHRVVADDAGSAQSRIPMLLATWSVIKQFPLFGVGLNNFADAFVRYDRTGLVQAHLAGFDNTVIVHNMYAFVWTETGFVGLLAFLWYGVSAFMVALAVVRGNESRWERAVAAGTAMGIFAQFAQGAWDIGFRFGSGGMVVAAQIGLLASLRLQRRLRLAPDMPRKEPPAGAGTFRTASAGNRARATSRFVATAIAVLALTGSAAAATLTVGPSGTYPSLDRVPWKTLQPGDDVLLQPGLVHEGSITIAARGKPDAPIRIAAAPGTGPTPIVHGSVTISFSTHLVLEGFTVEDERDVGIGIYRGSEHITVRHMTIRRNGLGLLIAYGAGGSNLIIDNEISNSAGQGIGIDDTVNEPGKETVISGNRVFDNGSHGIDITGSRFIVEGNTIYDNGRKHFGTSGIQIYAGGFMGTPHREGIGRYNIIRYNTIFRQHDDKAYDGNGVEADLWASDNEISYNICYDNDGAGIVVFGAARNRVINNTLIGNFRDSGRSHLPGGELVIATGEPQYLDAVAAGNIAKNNILVSTRGNTNPILVDRSAAHNGTQVGGNVLFRSGEGNLYSWSGQVGNDIGRWNELAKSVPADTRVDPMFVNVDDRPDGLRLRPESPAIGRGADHERSRPSTATTRSPAASEAGR